MTCEGKAECFSQPCAITTIGNQQLSVLPQQFFYLRQPGMAHLPAQGERLLEQGQAVLFLAEVAEQAGCLMLLIFRKAKHLFPLRSRQVCEEEFLPEFCMLACCSPE
ncbi:MAG: hypothetical protein ONB45_11465 [candidate division KSB1 bacterium]|nr:hypothetical protein [candidate division KSB1 bacterium]